MRGAMTPIFFPYTYMSSRTADLLGSLFKRVVMHLPRSSETPPETRRLAESGWLDARVPVKNGEEELAAGLQNYKVWADAHLGGRGADPALIRLHGERVPFFSDQRPTRIKADVMGRTTSDRPGETPGDEEAASLLKARMFLCMAQEFDAQKDEVNRRISSVEKMERDLMSGLKGDEEVLQMGGADGARGAAEDSDGRSTAERLPAWRRLMLRDASLDEPEPAAFFLTTSRDVFEEIVDAATGGETADSCDSLPVVEAEADETMDWMDRLDEHLNALVRDSWAAPAAGRIDVPDGERRSERTGERVSLRLFLIPDATPGEVFGPREKTNALSGAESRNILVGLVES